MSGERDATADSFTALGPDAPTILPGWDARELLEHLLVRESFPQLMLGASLPGGPGRRAAAARDRVGALPWEEQVSLLRGGPPRWSPAGGVDRLSGDAELLIHHEDLRRGQPGWQARRLPEEVRSQAWRATRLFARVMLRLPVDVTLVSPLGGAQRRSRRSEGAVRVSGEPMELLLWVSGRERVAEVRVEGDPGALARLEEAARRM